MNISGMAILALGLFTTATVNTAFPAESKSKCTSLQARCALEIGGTCNPKTGHWVYGWWNGRDWGGSNKGGAFDACIARGLAQKK
jgi:hypothetical protein